jgi:parallel beta-helix repeat protein
MGIYVESNDTTIENCDVLYFNYGVFVLGNNNAIENVESSGNSWAGIEILGEATGNTVRNSVFKSNIDQDGYGILLTGNVTYNKFINVRSKNNKRGLAIRTSSNFNSFSDLIVKSNIEYGIELDDSRSNTINDSTIKNNPIGISAISGASSNLIYNNHFNNTDNADIDSGSGINNWNTTKTSGVNIIGDPYIGGNFWHDYTGQDSDGDGLGDTTYNLGSGNYDYLPLLHPQFMMNFVSPTPANWSVLDVDWVFINVSANKVLDTCILEWDGQNETIISPGTYCFKNKTGLIDKSYTFRVWGNESLGNYTSTEEMVVTVYTHPPDNDPPSISYAIQPRIALNGSAVSLTISASDPSVVDSVWMVIDPLNSTPLTIGMTNGVATQYTTSAIPGTYNVTFFANDTLGNEGNVSDYFTTMEIIPQTNFTATVVGNNGAGIGCNLTVYQTGSSDVYANYYSTGGDIIVDLMNGVYDLLFDSYHGELQVLLVGVDIPQETNKTIGLDRPYPPPGFLHTYAVDSDYTISNAKVKIAYLESLASDEDYLGLYVCTGWNFSGEICGSGGWNRTNAIQNKNQDYFEVEVTSFSAFSIKQEPYCGDDVCSSDENPTTCPLDCECTQSDTRSCGISHDGICAVGDEICSNGKWTGCPAPGIETCDGEDDDCDGTVDDVLNGTSVSATQCWCYGGQTPRDEECNGIDDDCNGEIDEEGDCCTNDETRVCGPGYETGICTKGLSTCTNNVWGSCEGAVYAIDEICGNEEDDNCNGETDEECGFGFDIIGLILIMVGIVILIVIVILFLHFRSQGKELTWEELKNKWSPARM